MTPVMSIKNTAKYFAVGKFLNKFGAGQHYLFFGRGGVGQGSLENCLGRGSHLSQGKDSLTIGLPEGNFSLQGLLATSRFTYQLQC